MSNPKVNPELFKQAFVAWVQATGDVISLGNPSEGRDGEGGCCFELSSQHERPLEFLQCLLDLLRVTFEPCPFGSFQLNSNWDFVSESVPASPFKVGYLSLTGSAAESIQNIAQGVLAARMEQLGYRFGEAAASFVSVSAPRDRYTLAENTEVLRTFGAGFPAQEAFGAIKSMAKGEPIEFAGHKVFAGLARDDSLAANTVRISCLFFLSSIEH